MGQTKALLDVGGVPMATRVERALRAAGCGDVAVIGGAAGELDQLGLEVVADEYPGEGPVGGVLTALTRFAAAELVVITACDLPCLEPTTLSLLIELARREGPDVVVAQTGDQLQPAVGVWRPAIRPSLAACFGGGERSLHGALAQLNVASVDVAQQQLANINRPEDLIDLGLRAAVESDQ